MWELDYKESWAQRNWCYWTVVLEKTLERTLDYKEIQTVHSKGDQSWMFIGRTDVEAETPILWPPAVKSWLIWKDPDAGKDWRQEKGTTGWDGWMASLTQWTAVGDGQGGLACCCSWVCKKSDTTEWLNWTGVFDFHFFQQTVQFNPKWTQTDPKVRNSKEAEHWLNSGKTETRFLSFRNV